MHLAVEQFVSAKNLYGRMVDPVCKKYGLTQMEFHILLFLANNPELDTAAQITKYRDLTKSHVSVSVRSLTEKGLLEGLCRDGDRKTVHLRICPTAAPVIRDGRAIQEAFGDQLIRGFTQEEVQQLQAFLERIQDNIRMGE